MHKKTSKRSAISLTNKRKVPQNFLKIREFNEEPSSTNKITRRKSKRYDTTETEVDNELNSWERPTSSNFVLPSENIEEVATRKVLLQWEAVEKSLYEEDDQTNSGALFEECLQWRNQLLHLRTVGKNLISKSNTEIDDKKQNSALIKHHDSKLFDHEFSPKKPDDSYVQNRKELREYVFDQLVEYVCSELVLYEREIENSLSNDLDDILRITPAPVCTSKNPSAISKNSSRNAKRQNLTSAKLNNDTIPYPFENHKKSTQVTSRREEIFEESQKLTLDDPLQNDRLYTPQTSSRNKAGMVFDERVVVSPVPFVVSNRESFSTLRTNPILFMGQHFDLSKNQGLFSRNINTAYKVITPRRMSLTRLPQVRSAWQPTCSTPWTKNVKLAPMDVSTLPNPKKRTMAASAMVSNRCKNSLSPISQVATTKEHNESEEKVQLLEIQGTSIGQLSASNFQDSKAKSLRQKAERR